MRVNLGIRRRLAPLLGNNRRAMELMNGLLFSLPGTPVIYYGDEIGMGDNVYLGDRDGVRTPMQWSGDRNAGFSATNPQRLILPVIIDHEYHYQTVNVENQEHNLPLAAVVDAPGDRAAQAVQGLRPRHDRVSQPRESARAGFPAHLSRTSASWWSPIFRASCSTSNSISRASRGWCRSSCSAAPSFPRSAKCPTCLRSGRICSTGFRSSRRAMHRPWSRSRATRSRASKARPDGMASCAARAGKRWPRRCRTSCRDADGFAARRAR